MNKVKATISQTTQIPIQRTIITNGQSNTQFEFKDLVLSLDVTPQITFKGDVILEVELRREFAGDQDQQGGRELNKRYAKTTAMVKNGKTAVIGGIYQLDDGEIESGIPLLKDIPLIGYLFKQTKIEKLKNELLLFLKPKILKEVDGAMVSKASTNGSYNPFEELSVDEGSNEESFEEPSKAFENEGESDEDSFDDSEFEEEDSFSL